QTCALPILEGWAPLRLYVCVFAGCLSLRAMRGGADEVGTKGGRGGETRAGSFADVQAGDESVVGGGSGQVRAEVFVERQTRSGNLFVVLSAGNLPLRGVRADPYARLTLYRHAR